MSRVPLVDDQAWRLLEAFVASLDDAELERQWALYSAARDVMTEEMVRRFAGQVDDQSAEDGDGDG